MGFQLHFLLPRTPAWVPRLPRPEHSLREELAAPDRHAGQLKRLALALAVQVAVV